jgi:colicin import membrane protein
MARKLKTFQTSLGFYDLAIAAPSMKAALEAWGAGSNLFHQGVAKETDDPDVVAATMSKPGVVLKRPAGSNGRFAEHSDLPSDLGSAKGARPERRRAKPARRAAPQKPPKISEREARKAAADFEKEQKRREAERRREEAARQRDRERREQATAKAQAALDKAEREHAKRAAAIQTEIEALEKRSRAEDDRWEKERGRLQAALRRAGD